jgi:hypothetical protein
MADKIECFQFLTMLSPQSAKRAYVTIVSFISVNIFDENFCGALTSQKIIMTTTGSMVNDETCSRVKGVAAISLGSMCSFKGDEQELCDELESCTSLKRTFIERDCSHHSRFSSFDRVQQDNMLPCQQKHDGKYRHEHPKKVNNFLFRVDLRRSVCLLGCHDC